MCIRDRLSIKPKIFVCNVDEQSVQHGNDYTNKLFYHISSDEVYGSLGKVGYFNEDTPYNPSSPYSASKASSDHLVAAWTKTYKLPSIIKSRSLDSKPIPLILRLALK